MLHEFMIEPNQYLSQRIKAFYHINYLGYRRPGNPDYINTLKNTYNSYSNGLLNNAIRELENVLQEDLPNILKILQLQSMTVCVVPRAKAENSYHPNQLLFKSTVRNVVDGLDCFYDGVDYIVRHTNSKTTHLPPHTPNYNNDGESPYPRITIDTCNISDNVKGKEILLIDDIYTKTVNIDEDAIQALLVNGAKLVTFYAVGSTI